MPAWAISLAWRGESGDPGAGHRELEHLRAHRLHHRARIELDRRRGEVAVEEVVEVLVDGDAAHHLVPAPVVEPRAGVAVGDARRQLLQA